MGSPLKIEKALPRTKTKEKEEGEEQTTNSGEPTAKPSKRTSPKRNRKEPQTSNTKSDSQSIQPDPRWAQELALLKERLAAQTSNS